MHLQGWPYSSKNKNWQESHIWTYVIKNKGSITQMVFGIVLKNTLFTKSPIFNQFLYLGFTRSDNSSAQWHKMPITLRDFNIPSNKDHINTKLMQDTLNLFHLFQNVTLQRHKAGNTLDWILITNESLKENPISDIANQDFLSVHCILKFKTALPRSPTESSTITNWSLDRIDLEKSMCVSNRISKPS